MTLAASLLNDFLSQAAAFRIKRNVPVILQSEAAECGLACLTMVAAHFGHDSDLPAMRTRFTTSLKGMTLRDLTVLAGAIGLATRALRVDLSSLSELKLPAILHWNHNHFVVLTHVSSRYVILHDPALGRRRVVMDAVSKHFTGVALETWPTERFEKTRVREGINLLSLLGRTHGLRGAILQVLSFSILLEVVTIGMPIAFQVVIDHVIVSADHDLLALVCIGLALLLVIKVVVGFFRSWATMMFGSSLLVQWKVSLFDHLIRLPLGYFEKRHVGDIVSRFGSLDSIQDTVTTRSATVLLDGLMSLALVFMMYLYGGYLAAIAIVAVVTYVLLRLLTYGHYRSLSEEALIEEAKESSHFMESVRGMASLKALNLEARRRAVWVGYLVNRVGARLRTERFNILFTGAGQTLFGIDRILMVYLGGKAILDGGMSIGMFIAFMSYKDQFAERINSFVDTAISMRMLSLHGERIADIAVSPTEDQETQGLAFAGIATRQEGASSLSLRAVSFRYGASEPDVLRNVNIDIRLGECIAVTGPSGAGKSTLLKIMAGLIEPSQGDVVVDGRQLRSIGLAQYRQRTGCVLQEDRLFAGSIGQNIAGFDQNPDLAFLRTCAQMAAIDEEIVRMPMGYETLVGDMGSTLSGGQRQRVVLARALYRRPGILLLDEATSHLDPENEEKINAALARLPLTRIIVAHRPTSIAVADRMVPVCRFR